MFFYLLDTPGPHSFLFKSFYLFLNRCFLQPLTKPVSVCLKILPLMFMNSGPTVCRYVCGLGGGVYKCVRMWCADHRTLRCHSFSDTIHVVFETGSLIGWEIAKHTGLAGQQVQGNLSLFVALTLVLQASATMSFFFFLWVWRSNLDSHACKASTFPLSISLGLGWHLTKDQIWGKMKAVRLCLCFGLFYLSPLPEDPWRWGQENDKAMWPHPTPLLSSLDKP